MMALKRWQISVDIHFLILQDDGTDVSIFEYDFSVKVEELH